MTDHPPSPRTGNTSRRRAGIVGLMFVASAAMVAASLPDDAFARRGRGFSRSFGKRSFGRRSFGGSRSRRSFGRRSRGKSRSLFGGARKTRSRGKGGLFGKRKRSGRGRAFGRGKSGSIGRKSNRLSSQRAARRARSRAFRNTGSATRARRASSFRQRYRTPTYRFRRGYWGGSRWGGWGWGYRSVGVWDLFFLSTVNHMFWYHHWHDPGIQRALYKDNLMQKEELRRLEQKVQQLEANGVQRDPKYLPEGVDADLAYSKEYVHHNKEQFESASEDAAPTAEQAAEAEDEGVGWFWILLGLGGVAVFFYAFFVRKY